MLTKLSISELELPVAEGLVGILDFFVIVERRLRCPRWHPLRIAPIKDVGYLREILTCYQRRRSAKIVRRNTTCRLHVGGLLLCLLCRHLREIAFKQPITEGILFRNQLQTLILQSRRVSFVVSGVAEGYAGGCRDSQPPILLVFHLQPIEIWFRFNLGHLAFFGSLRALKTGQLVVHFCICIVEASLRIHRDIHRRRLLSKIL